MDISKAYADKFIGGSDKFPLLLELDPPDDTTPGMRAIAPQFLFYVGSDTLVGMQEVSGCRTICPVQHPWFYIFSWKDTLLQHLRTAHEQYQGELNKLFTKSSKQQADDDDEEDDAATVLQRKPVKRKKTKRRRLERKSL